MLKRSSRRSQRRIRSAVSREAAGWISQFIAEPLETRLQLSTNVLTFHNDGVSDGVNNSETTLSPTNVKVGSFGKTATVPVDGNVYAEPLVYTSDTITSGPNTETGAAGVHDVVFVATENDSLYAVDMHSGAILWQRSFLNIGAGAGSTAGTDINNPLNATAIAAPNDNDIQSQDIDPVFGITGTPVVDPNTGIIYLVAFTKETVNGVPNFVQRLHAISVANGTDVGTPFLIGNTTGSNTNTTQIYVYGNGDGSVTDPYNDTGKQVVQFNTIRENQRAALAMENNTVYVCWASHSDNNPYHGWVAGFNISNVATTGITLQGVFCSSPNGGQAGIWMGGGKPSFESNGNTFYVETGNGDATGATVVNTAGFPITGDYYEAAIKITIDPTTSPTNQNINGWGLKAVDYFIPSNQPALDNADQDLGSGNPLILPPSAGIPGHPDLMLVEGKQGVVYLIDRDNMGKYNPNYDNVLNAYNVGQATPPVAVSGVLSTPVFYNGTIYIVSGYSGPVEAFSINSNGTLSETSQSTQSSFGYLPGSPVLSANGTTGGVLWVSDRSSNELHAYDANSLSTELWNSADKANGADDPGSLDKMNAPTVADGEVFLGTSNSLDIYGVDSTQHGGPQRTCAFFLGHLRHISQS
jgi:hypothetical protein